MRRIQPLLIGIVLFAWSVPAMSATTSHDGAPANWSIGANLGLSFVNPET